MRRRRKGDNCERMCIGCRQLRHKRSLIRIATLPHQCAIIDKAQRLGGRGVYLCPIVDCLITATKTRQWDRYLRGTSDRQTLLNLLRQLGQEAFWMTGDLKQLWQMPTPVR